MSTVQHKSATGNGTSLAVAFTSSPAIKNTLICGVGTGGGSGPVLTPTDTIANSWTSGVAGPHTNGGLLAFHYCTNKSTAADTVTGIITTGDDIHVHIYEVAGLMTGGQLDLTNSGAGTGAAGGNETVSTAGNTNQAIEYVWAMFYDNSHNTTYTAVAPWTNVESSGNTGGDTAGSTDGDIITVQTPTVTINCAAHSAAFDAIIATFKYAVVPGWKSPVAGPSFAI